MSTPVNLNKARKARGKVKNRAQADENAAKFGLTKQQRALNKTRKQAEISRLDGHKRDDR